MTSADLDELCRHAKTHGEAVLYTPPGNAGPYGRQVAPPSFELIPDGRLIDHGVVSFYPVEEDDD